MPSMPVPTNEQIETAREIAQLYSFTETETLIGRLNDAQWTATLLDIIEWEKVKNKHTRIEGDGVKIDKDRNRLDITIRLRRRLGIYPADSSADSSPGSYCSYTPPMDDGDCCFDR